jgi:glutaconate CoA-transferase subunit B
MTTEPNYTASELLAVMSGRLLEDGQVVFAGVGIPLLAATLAQSLHGPGLTILFEGGTIGAFVEPGKLPPSTNEQRCTRRANMVLSSTDVLLLLQRGYVDVGFMGGAQIDRHGNLNSSFIGDPDNPITRLPGTGGCWCRARSAINTSISVWTVPARTANSRMSANNNTRS